MALCTYTPIRAVYACLRSVYVPVRTCDYLLSSDDRVGMQANDDSCGNLTTSPYCVIVIES